MIHPDDEMPMDIELDSEALVICPHCGEQVVIHLDPASGSMQTYDEDCEVCCRPWRVTVQYDYAGKAEVELDQAY